MIYKTLLVLSTLAFATGKAEITTSFKLLTQEAGIYKVTFEELAAQGLQAGQSSSEIGIFNLGNPVPLWVEDGGDQLFGPGDWLEFRGDILHGSHSYYHEYSNFNVYLLKFGASRTQRMKPRQATTKMGSNKTLPNYHMVQHLEVDTLFMRFSSRKAEAHEVWYWHKLACNDAEPFTQGLRLNELDPNAGGAATLTVDLRGWSQIRRRLKDAQTPDHRLELTINDQVLEPETWDGKESHRFQRQIPLDWLRVGENELSLRIPARKDREDQLIIDVAILNWIEMAYPRNAVANPEGQSRFKLADSAQNGRKWRILENRDLLIYGDGGTRFSCRPSGNTAVGVVQFRLDKGETAFTTVSAGKFLAASEILPVTEVAPRKPPAPVDYIMIGHPALMSALKPLANAHEQNGLRVKVVDVNDIYNAFNHGVFHPSAIRDFLAHAYHNWPKPSPRFVLLVGDASWDTKNSKVVDHHYPDRPRLYGKRTFFNKIESTHYGTDLPNTRNLIPTMNFFGPSGHSASDNWFVCVDGDDFQPDMAIGRFPVTSPEEVSAIAAKSIRYLQGGTLGPWRVNTLWITNEEPGFQRQSDHLAKQMAEKGFAAQKIYPASKEKSNEQHTRTITDALDQGQYLVYFYGHGGRFIWRTGPPDPRKNHDLFTLKDVERLQTSDKYPIVLSFTCFTAPFDHPGADSIGEKFLRLADRGAIAFIGASWRNSPHLGMQIPFMEAFSGDGTIGEAMVAAKGKIRSRLLVETYNLMGDPALPLRTVPREVRLTQNEEKSLIEGTVPWRAGGQGVLDLADADGAAFHRAEFRFEGHRFSFEIPETEIKPVWVRCYVWNREAGREAMGLLSLMEKAAETTKPARAKSPKTGK